MSAPDPFVYHATLLRVIDADTVVLDLDMGFHQARLRQSYRLLRIDAPELTTPAGIVARSALVDYLPGKDLVVQTHKSDSFGRYLVDLWADGQNVNDWLVVNGHAVLRSYSG